MSKPLKMIVPISYIMNTLKEAGLCPYIHSSSGSSKYIKFHKNIAGSLRISDHPQRSRYAYRWNLRTDKLGVAAIDKLDSKCMYYPAVAFHKMVEDMVHTMNVLKERSKPKHQEPLNLLSGNVKHVPLLEDPLLPYHQPKRAGLFPEDKLKAKGDRLVKLATSRPTFDKYDYEECHTYMGGHF